MLATSDCLKIVRMLYSVHGDVIIKKLYENLFSVILMKMVNSDQTIEAKVAA